MPEILNLSPFYDPVEDDPTNRVVHVKFSRQEFQRLARLAQFIGGIGPTRDLLEALVKARDELYGDPRLPEGWGIKSERVIGGLHVFASGIPYFEWLTKQDGLPEIPSPPAPMVQPATVEQAIAEDLPNRLIEFVDESTDDEA